MYKMRYVLFVISVILLSACNRHSEMEETLTETEAIMDEHPDSALALLDGIEAGDLRSEKLRAYFALLKSQAMDKSFIDVKDDSLISIARNYYSDSNDRYHRMLSQYYYGRVKFNAEDYSQSILAYLLALDLGKELNDYFWQGMAAREIAVVYNKTFNVTNHLKYSKLAFDYFTKSGKQPYLNHAILDLGAAYSNTRNYDKCIRVLKTLPDSAAKYNDTYLQMDINRVLGTMYFSCDNYEKAIENWTKISESGYGSIEDSAYLALGYVKSNRFSEAVNILNNISDTDNTVVNVLKYEIYSAKKKTAKALNSLEKIDSITNDVLKNKMSQGLTSSITSFYEQEKKINKAEVLSFKRIIYLTILISFLIVLIVFILLFYRKKKQESIIENNVLIAQNLRDTLYSKEVEFSSAKNMIRKLLSSKYQMIDVLCQLVYESNDSAAVRRKISDSVTTLIKQISSDSKKIEELENFVNLYDSNIMSMFRTDLPKLNDDYYKLFLFSILGFSDRTISVFLGKEKVSSVYNLRRHLKDKIKLLNAEKRNHYLKYV